MAVLQLHLALIFRHLMSQIYENLSWDLFLILIMKVLAKWLPAIRQIWELSLSLIFVMETWEKSMNLLNVWEIREFLQIALSSVFLVGGKG